MTFLFLFKIGGAKLYCCSMLNIIINRRTICTYLNVRFSMNPSIVISSSRTKSMIPGSSRVAMVILLSFRVVTILRCVGWVGLLILSICDIFIADSTGTYLLQVGNVLCRGPGRKDRANWYYGRPYTNSWAKRLPRAHHNSTNVIVYNSTALVRY